MGTFRLLHFSDLHLTSPFWRTSSNWRPEVLEAVARLTYRLGGQIDAVLVTGDLADWPSFNNLGAALDFLSQPSTHPKWLDGRKRPTIKDAGVRVIVLPGNHDRFRAQFRWPGDTRFDWIFSPASYWCDGLGGVEIVSFDKRDGSQLVLGCADFTLRHRQEATTRFGIYGQGRVNPVTLQKLVAQTQNALKQSDTSAALWLVHFAPAFPRIDPNLALNEENLLLDTAQAVGVRHILCGHTHQMNHYQPRTSPDVFVQCAGNAAGGGKPSVHLVEVGVERAHAPRVRRIDFLWDQTAGDFRYK